MPPDNGRGSGALQLLQVLSFAFISSYLTVEYVWPFVKRHWWGRQSTLQKRLQVSQVNAVRGESSPYLPHPIS